MTDRRPGYSPGVANVLLAPGMWDNIRLSWRLARDARVAPLLKMIVPIVVLLYVVSPIDMIPDFLLGLGQMDDLGILGVALVLAVRLLPRIAPAEILDEHLSALGLRPETDRVGASPVPVHDHFVETSFRVHGQPADGGSR
jgi:uncharacterized membrane protein YkvA (DUF1232 family)